MTADQEATMEIVVRDDDLVAARYRDQPAPARAHLARRSAQATGRGVGRGIGAVVVYTVAGGVHVAATWSGWMWQPEAATPVRAEKMQARAVRRDLEAVDKALKRAQKTNSGRAVQRGKAAGVDTEGLTADLKALRREADRLATRHRNMAGELRRSRLGRFAVSLLVQAAVFAAGVPVAADQLHVSLTLGYSAAGAAVGLVLFIVGALVTDRTPPVDQPTTYPSDEAFTQVSDTFLPEIQATDPFPLAHARDRREIRECFARALTHDRVKAEVIDLEEPIGHPWGAEQAIVTRTPPSVITDKLDAIETLMDLRVNGLLVQQDPERRARLILRAVERDPFANMAPLRVADPNSLSIVDPLDVGQRIDQADLLLELLGVNGLVVARSRGGKSIAAMTIGERITACLDAMLMDVDISGAGGLDELGDAVSRKARTPDEARELIGDLLLYAKVRPTLRRKLGMKRLWDASAQYPAITVVIDEFARLPDDVKAMVKELQQIGLKACIQVIILAQEGVERALGSAMAQEFQMRIMLPSREADIVPVLGGGMKEQGWRPDRLRSATRYNPYDAGCGYVLGGRHTEPILIKFSQLREQDAARIGAERAGSRPRVEQETVVAAARLRTAGAGGPPRGGLDRSQQARDDLDVAMDDGDRITSAAAVAAMRLAHPDRYRDLTQDGLAELLRPLGITPRTIRLGPEDTAKGYRRGQLDGGHMSAES